MLFGLPLLMILKGKN